VSRHGWSIQACTVAGVIDVEAGGAVDGDPAAGRQGLCLSSPCLHLPPLAPTGRLKGVPPRGGPCLPPRGSGPLGPMPRRPNGLAAERDGSSPEAGALRRHAGGEGWLCCAHTLSLPLYKDYACPFFLFFFSCTRIMPVLFFFSCSRSRSRVSTYDRWTAQKIRKTASKCVTWVSEREGDCRGLEPPQGGCRAGTPAKGSVVLVPFPFPSRISRRHNFGRRS